MTSPPHVLGAVGVTADAERIYRALLARPGSTTSELREITGLSARRLRNALIELEGKAIVTRRSGTPARFQPAPPDSVVEAESALARLLAIVFRRTVWAAMAEPAMCAMSRNGMGITARR